MGSLSRRGFFKRSAASAAALAIPPLLPEGVQAEPEQADPEPEPTFVPNNPYTKSDTIVQYGIYQMRSEDLIGLKVRELYVTYSKLWGMSYDMDRHNASINPYVNGEHTNFNYVMRKSDRLEFHLARK